MLVLNLAFAACMYSQTPVKTFADKVHGFSFNYPGDFTVLVGPKAKSETAFGDPGAGSKLVSVTPRHIPDNYHGDYEFNVWRSNDPKAKCGEPVEGDHAGDISVTAPDSEKTRMIGSHTFYAYSGSEGGMSKTLELSGYRGMVGGKCWQIQSMSYQVSAFDHFKYFDSKIIAKAFEKFVASFQFVK